MKLSAIVLLINGGPAFRSTCLPVGRLLVAFVPHFTVGYLLQLAYRQAGPDYSSAVNLFSTFFFCAVPTWIASMVTNSKPLRDLYEQASIFLIKTRLIFKSIFTSSLSLRKRRVCLNFFGNAVAPPLHSSRPPSPRERE